MATKLTKKQKELLTDKITGMIRNSPVLRMTLDSSVNEMNINQISGELNRIHYRAIGKDLPPAISFAPKQAGSGDPSPTNIRLISGYEIDGIGTVYGGNLNIETGVLTIDRAMVMLDGDETITKISNSSYERYTITISDIATPSGAVGIDGLCADWLTSAQTAGDYIFNYITNQRLNIYLPLNTTTYDTPAHFKAYLAENPLTVVYPLATPTTTTLTAQQMLQLIDHL